MKNLSAGRAKTAQDHRQLGSTRTETLEQAVLEQISVLQHWTTCLNSCESAQGSSGAAFPAVLVAQPFRSVLIRPEQMWFHSPLWDWEWSSLECNTNASYECKSSPRTVGKHAMPNHDSKHKLQSCDPSRVSLSSAPDTHINKDECVLLKPEHKREWKVKRSGANPAEERGRAFSHDKLPCAQNSQRAWDQKTDKPFLTRSFHLTLYLKNCVTEIGLKCKN